MRLPTRDSFVWSLMFASSVLMFVAVSTTTLIPTDWVPRVKELAAVLAFVSGKLGNSPLPGRPRD